MEIGGFFHLNHSPETPVTVSQMWPSVGWVCVLFPWLKQWMHFSRVLCQLHPPPSNSCRTCLIAGGQRGWGRKATRILWHRSLQNSLLHSHHVLNVLRVTDFISKLYESSGQEIHSGHKTSSSSCCCGCSASENSKFLKKKKWVHDVHSSCVSYTQHQLMSICCSLNEADLKKKKDF